MQIPSEDPTSYCRLCFTQQQLRWLLQSNTDPMVPLIQASLDLVLVPDVDFPCTVCRLCSAALETFEALRERVQICDAALRSSRTEIHPPPSPSPIGSAVVECKQECISPEPEARSEHVLPVAKIQKEPSSHLESTSNTIMVGDIKLELLNVRPKANISIVSPPKPNKPKKFQFGCHRCEQTFTKETYLYKHIRSKHSTKGESNTMPAAVAAKLLRSPLKRPGEFKPISPKDIRKQLELDSALPKPNHYSCSLCAAKFSQRHLFVRHQKTHDDPIRVGHTRRDLQNVTTQIT